MQNRSGSRETCVTAREAVVRAHKQAYGVADGPRSSGNSLRRGRASSPSSRTTETPASGEQLTEWQVYEDTPENRAVLNLPAE